MKRNVFSISSILLLFLVSMCWANTNPLYDVDENSPMYKAAQRAANLHYSKKIQEKIAQQEERLRAKYKGKLEGGAFSVGSSENEDMCSDRPPRILVFISESMPIELQRRLAEESFALMESDTAEIKFILRGEPQIGVKPFGRSLNPDGRGMIVSVDPFLYKKLEIERVPIVIFDRKLVVKFPESLLEATEILTEEGYDYSELSLAIKENI